MEVLALSPENEFSFRCPIFNVETKMSACMKLRELVWRGEKVPVRKGCQACMHSNKCPAVIIVSRAIYTKVSVDEYGSKTPKVGRLKDDVLKRILPVMVRDTHLEVHQVPEIERNLIASANARISKMIGSVVKAVAEKAESVLGSIPSTPAPVKNDISEAARTGDLSAALKQED